MRGLLKMACIHCGSEKIHVHEKVNASRLLWHSVFDLKELQAKNVERCCDACRVDSKCVFWTYLESNSTCHLKTSDAGRTSRAGAISGSSIAPPPPSSKRTKIAALVTSNTVSPTSLIGMSVFLSFWTLDGTEADRSVCVSIPGAKDSPKYATEYRIDATHANPHAKWISMGSPAKPSPAQISELIEASQVIPTRVPLLNASSISVRMGPNSAVLLVF